MYRGKVVAALGLAGPAKRLYEEYIQRFAERFLQEKFDIIKL